MTLTTYLLVTGPSMLGEDDRKILTTSAINSLHTQALNHPVMILNEVNGYCSIASGLVMVDMQSSYIEFVCVRMQIVYVVQLKLLNRDQAISELLTKFFVTGLAIISYLNCNSIIYIYITITRKNQLLIYRVAL